MESTEAEVALGACVPPPADVLRRLSLGGLWLGFWSLVAATARVRLSYRASALIAVLSNVAGSAVFLLVWSEVYRAAPGRAPLAREQMLAYLVLAIAINSTLTLNTELRFWRRLTTGLIAIDLLRPLGFLPFQMAQALSDALVNFLCTLPVLLLCCLCAGAGGLPLSPGPILLCLLSTILAFLVNFGISYLLVQAAFVTDSVYGLLFARVAAHQCFSGVAAPLVAFPQLLHDVAMYLPFRHVIETPVRIGLSQVQPGETARLLASQAGWAIALLGAACLLLRAALRQHQIQGG